MLTNEEKEIYNRHLILDKIGEAGQIRLKESAVLVIGAGGLGCPVLQYLAAAGIGKIGIVDHDVVEKSNLQRQILFGHSSIGRSKAHEAKKRLEDINPFIEIKAFNLKVDVDNVLELIHDYHIIVDCTDNYPTRYLLNDACVLMDKPSVYGSIHKFEGQVSVFNWKGGPTYRCLYPEIPKSESIMDCSEGGVLGVLPGIIGVLQSNEVIKMVIQLDEVLSGKVLLYSSLTNSMRSFNVALKKSAYYNNLKVTRKLDSSAYNINCEIDNDTFGSIAAKFEQLVDVRELDELPRVDMANKLAIPLKELSERYSEIDPHKKTLVFCKSGSRSASAINKLKELGVEIEIENLEGGINAFQQ